ncbi:carboxypeptidase M32 [Mangrovibacillus cuniculi]|uniref:Metal-dependent carboxypeptidase n=1 Tax=Mangrovibacillus cuniculi TaxID=2593652 RepID=A0A7S8CAY7_9BACI|nr:carboxypeptidase M32 [Mangrovibacillus cuniculi]QPC46651.1 carboxypeptidase M32 [Mangrovibacillus cuniculi]
MTTKSIEEVKASYYDYVKKMEAYGEALGLMFWDLRTGAPKKGIEQRSEAIGMLSSEIFEMSTSEEMKSYIKELSSVSNLDEKTAKMVQESKKDLERNLKIPAEEYKEMVILRSKAENVWESAKNNADFKSFQPYLERLVELTKKFIGYWGYEENPYNTLLDMYEPGMTVEILDRVFGQLRSEIVPLVKLLDEKGVKPKTDFLFKPFPKAQQKEFSLYVLDQLSYDFEAGRLDETVHPFALGLNPGDVRVTTKYDEKDWRTAIFGTIHEAGHALYEQNISQDLVGTNLCSGTSMGIHESQSLFYENFVGRNEKFWEKNYEALKSYSEGQFDQVSLEDFYRAINESKPSLIRIEADELTYPLHVMVRYEIEKGLFNGEIEVKDLPEVWNAKYKEYLGVVPEHDGEGVLQDVHWSGGSFGYFPSYALGYMYAAQIKVAMDKDIPEYDELLLNGDTKPIREWLTEKIHQHGKLKQPLEILKEVTGEELNAQYLVDYLKAKYKRVYQITE